MKVISLQLSPAEAKKDAGLPLEASENLPKYPYGTSLSLDDDELKKLGITGEQKAGTKFIIAGMVEVVGYSKDVTQAGERECLRLQITELGLAKKGKTVAETFYGAAGEGAK